MGLMSEFDHAVAARDRALEQVTANAPAGWEDAALAWLRSYLETHAKYVPDVHNRQGPEPPEKRAWGIVIRRAIKAGWIKRIGYQPRTRGHCTPGPVYGSMILRGGR